MGKKFVWDKKYLYWGVTAFCVIACSILFFFLINRWRSIFSFFGLLLRLLSPFIYGFLLSYLLLKPMAFFERAVFKPFSVRVFPKNAAHAKTLSRAFSVGVTELLFLALIGGLLALALPQIYISLQKLFISADSYYRYITAWITKFLDNNPELESYFIGVVGDVTTYVKNLLNNTLLPQMESIVTSIYGGVSDLLRTLLNFIIGIIISLYALYSHERFAAQSKKMLYGAFKAATANKILTVTRFIDKTCGGFIVGKLLDSLIVGIIAYIFLLIFKIPYATIVAVLVGITNIIPFFGPFIGAIPSAFIILLEDPVKCLIFVIFIIVLQQLDGNVIGPKILGNALGMNAFWVMFSILLFGGLFGFWGMLLGVPIFAVIYEGLRLLFNSLLRRRNLPSDTSSYGGGAYVDADTNVLVETADSPDVSQGAQPPK